VMLELRERALLVQPHQPAVTGDIGSQDGRQPSVQALACQIRLPSPRRELYRISAMRGGNSRFHRADDSFGLAQTRSRPVVWRCLF
jgi:hypothetical protein